MNRNYTMMILALAAFQSQVLNCGQEDININEERDTLDSFMREFAKDFNSFAVDAGMLSRMTIRKIRQ